jgi:hypothetical protein
MSEAARKPIDAVYTWVDGSDPSWKARKQRRLAEQRRHHGSVDGDASSDARFRDRQELRYSLRALERFAPFIRKVHLVTDRQVPSWLDAGHPDLQIVFHDAIFPDPSHLPTFNSYAIESHLHRIPGLAERFVYFNDDILLSAPVTEADFFDEVGRSRVYLDRRRVVWAPEHPHYARGVNAAARNSSHLIKGLGGPRIEHRVDHTPYALRRSLLKEMWGHFGKELDAVSAHPFRWPGTLAPTSCLAQHFGMLKGRAVATSERNLTYFKVKKRDDKPWAPYKFAWRLLRYRLSRRRARSFLSINDAGQLDDSNVTAAAIALFFRSIEPRRSRFEKRRSRFEKSRSRF